MTAVLMYLRFDRMVQNNLCALFVAFGFMLLNVRYIFQILKLIFFFNKVFKFLIYSEGDYLNYNKGTCNSLFPVKNGFFFNFRKRSYLFNTSFLLVLGKKKIYPTSTQWRYTWHLHAMQHIWVCRLLVRQNYLKYSSDHFFLTFRIQMLFLLYFLIIQLYLIFQIVIL